jgi:RND family efflux transporter MFP subunit
MLRVRRLIGAGKVKSARDTDVPIWLGLADEEGFPHEGRVDFIDNKVDRMTGTLEIRGKFSNPNDLLAPGFYARIRTPIGVPHQAILVPERALASDQGQKFLYVVDDHNKVQYRRVTVGALRDGLRVIEDGLAAGEKVIVSGLQRVRAGVEVVPKLVDAQAPSAAPAVVTKPESASGAPAADQPATAARRGSG